MHPSFPDSATVPSEPFQRDTPGRDELSDPDRYSWPLRSASQKIVEGNMAVTVIICETAGSVTRARRARYVPVSTGAEGQPRSLTEDRANRRRSRRPPVSTNQGHRLPKLIVRVRFGAPTCQASSTAGSHAGSHTDERHLDSPDFHGQPTGTHPRSRTDLNGSGRPHMELRIKRSGLKRSAGRAGIEHLRQSCDSAR
jgi:hypothetical protein